MTEIGTETIDSRPELTSTLLRCHVLVQPELEKRRFPLVKVPPLRGGDFQGMGVYRPMLLPDYEYAAREDQLPRCFASAR
jgi:hypothetical protein